MRKVTASLLLPALLALTACEEEEQVGEESASGSTPQWMQEEQVHRQDPAVVEADPEGPPVAAVERFFEALGSGNIAAAAGEVAQRPLETSTEELVRDIEQWASGGTVGNGEPVRVLDSYERGDFAIARVEFPAEGQNEPGVRPVVLFAEEGEWRIVWDLLGKQREQVAQGVQDQLDPLYDWYEQGSLRAEPDAAGADDAAATDGGGGMPTGEDRGYRS